MSWLAVNFTTIPIARGQAYSVAVEGLPRHHAEESRVSITEDDLRLRSAEGVEDLAVVLEEAAGVRALALPSFGAVAFQGDPLALVKAERLLERWRRRGSARPLSEPTAR